jgi:hypothetical protein
MKFTLSLLALIASFNSFATTTFKIQCQEMDYPFVNRFNLNTELTVGSNLRENGAANFWYETINFNLTDRGVDGNTSENFEVTSTGTVKYFAPGVLAKDEVIQVRSAAKDSEGYFINLLLNYPTKNASTIRTADGKAYKANCTIVSENACIFGDSLGDIEESTGFSSQDLGDFFVQSRIYEGTADADYDVDFKPEVSKVLFTHKESNRKFTAFYTFDDQWDGGNTIGWIEDNYGNKVASIGDGDIYDCKAFK